MYIDHKEKTMLYENFIKIYKEYQPKNEIVNFEGKYYQLTQRTKKRSCSECEENMSCYNSVYGYWYYIDKKNKLSIDECIFKNEYDFKELELDNKQLLELKITNSIKKLEPILIFLKKEDQEIIIERVE